MVTFTYFYISNIIRLCHLYIFPSFNILYVYVEQPIPTDYSFKMYENIMQLSCRFKICVIMVYWWNHSCFCHKAGCKSCLRQHPLEALWDMAVFWTLTVVAFCYYGWCKNSLGITNLCLWTTFKVERVIVSIGKKERLASRILGLYFRAVT